MQRRRTPAEQVAALSNELQADIERWKKIRRYGCNDPNWTDGCNMNLVRNQVIYEKRQISILCATEGMVLPDAFYKPVPPPVSDNYMARKEPKGEAQKRRYARLESDGTELDFKKPRYDEKQLSFC